LLHFLVRFISIRIKSNFRKTLSQKIQGNFLLFKLSHFPIAQKSPASSAELLASGTLLHAIYTI